MTMPEVVEIQKVDDPRDVIHRAVQHLSAGELVVLPTECAYVIAASSLDGAAVGRLNEFSRQKAGEDAALSLIVKGIDEALDFVPDMSSAGQKLGRRSWPGPIILEFDVSAASGILRSLPQATYDSIVHNGQLRLRVSQHQLIREIRELLPAPLVFSVELRSESQTPAGWIDQIDEKLAFVIDAGPCQFSDVPSVVSVTSDGWNVLSEGLLSRGSLARLASQIYLFVCTGNTCRSPMAEALFRKILSKKLECSEDQLTERGFVVVSAGLAAANGTPASTESIETMKKHGIDLSVHGSQPLTARLLDQADHVYTMTRSHLDCILADRPDTADRVELLTRDGKDIPDPIGAGAAEYERCQSEINRHLIDIISKIDAS